MEESIIKNVIKFMCAHGNIDVLFKNEEEFYEEYKQAQALQLQQTGVSTCFLEDCEDHFFEIKYKQVSCCKISPITNENYCPNCGNKILK